MLRQSDRPTRRTPMNSKRGLLGIAFAGAILSISLVARAHGNEEGSAKAVIGSTKVSVDFRRPTLKGRDLMKLIHPGDLWRLGADIPTTIESDGDLDFGGT